ncbi:hypothetical protein CAPTEDRAFT_19399 [Capitella teleta]|uniref:SH3 domain-containing protein n=1 Tax=Capitella teleta TaxID=283909 RepID=R7VGG4_CAPTE|nr:hypothetical protein CAPTEDRAFT_19399 [Capitella teleta]|eukprot:ELU15406.1 hypothetical protein CAPTEDRAFT_19399 [Capitella teleta]
MVNTPVPHSLKSEAKKAAKILQDFSMPSTKVGPDGLIPAGVIVRAAGLAILSVVKVGFLVTARAGSGIVIAKLNDGSWSAPSAIGIAGLGGGFEIGAEVTDFVIILNSKSAVDAFSMGGNLTLGGNFTIAAGPIGRNIEGDVSMRSTAAIYTYSKTKGLFAGISIEGSCLIERKDANKKFYCESVRASAILSGEVDPPESCHELYEVLEHHEEMLFKVMKSHAKAYATKTVHDQFGLEASSSTEATQQTTSPSSPPKSSSGFVSKFKVSAGSPEWKKEKKPAGIRVETLFPYSADKPCDLSFDEGDFIEVLTQTESQDDWWEGRMITSAGEVYGKTGIFPANYVQLPV